MALAPLVFLLSLSTHPSHATDITASVSSLLSVPSRLGDGVTTASCDFFVTESVAVDADLSEWMATNGRGVIIVDVNDGAAFNASNALRALWYRSYCAYMLHSSESADEMARAKAAFHKFKIAKKALIVVTDNDDLNGTNRVSDTNTEILSYDTVLISPNQTQITCQKIGNVILEGASNLSDCYDLETLLKGNDLQTSIILTPPWIVSTKDPIKGVDILTLNSLRDKFGFKYHFKLEPNFGIEKLPNGQYVGISASMRSRESDLALGELTNTPERYKYVEYSTPMYSIEVVFQTPLPAIVKSYNSIFLPMDSTGWISTGLAIVFIGLILVFIDWLYGNNFSSQKFVNVSLTYATLIQLNVPPRWINYKSFKSRRVLLSFYLPLAALISMGYKSVLLVTLTFTQYHSPINSPEDILAAGLPVLVQKSTSVETTFAGSPIPIIQKLYKEACLDKNGLYPFNGTYPRWVLDLIAEGRAVGLTNKILTDVSKNHIGDTILVAPTSVWYTKGSRIRPYFDAHLSLLSSTGHLQMFLRKFDRYTNLGNTTMARNRFGYGADAGPIKAEHFLPIFVVQSAGIIIAVGLFVYEMVGRRCSQSKITFGIHA